MPRKVRTDAEPTQLVTVPGLPAPVEVTATVLRLIAAGAPVAMGVSGGKDSCGLVFATEALLDFLGHEGPRLLARADLGVVEWEDSIRTCRRLALAVGRELAETSRAKGGMMERWEQRQDDNVARYAQLKCVRLVLPWSTATMRFCTKELKLAPIGKLLSQRWAGHEILSASGIRRDESRDRAKASTLAPFPEVLRKKTGTSGWSWNPIANWTLADVLALLKARGFELHEGYGCGMSRISCIFCILANMDDLRTSSAMPRHRDVYRRYVRLEARSTFSFRSDGWLGDVAPHLLEPAELAALERAKLAAEVRERAESRIPEHLLYTKGWPLIVPTEAETHMMAEVRATVADAVGLRIAYTRADEFMDRYRQLVKANKDPRAGTIPHPDPDGLLLAPAQHALFL